MRECKFCGTAFEPKEGPGRPQQYCHKKCRDTAGREAAKGKRSPAVAPPVAPA